MTPALEPAHRTICQVADRPTSYRSANRKTPQDLEDMKDIMTLLEPHLLRRLSTEAASVIALLS
jgi:hypothetical protein